MKSFLDVKFEKFTEDFELPEHTQNINWRRFVNYHFFSQFQPGRLDTDSDLLDQICVHSTTFSEVHGALFLLNGQILSSRQDITDILQRDQKGLFELYFLTFGNIDDFAQQIEQIFYGLDTNIKGEPWLDVLSYSMSQKIVLRWKSDPVLNVISYSDQTDKTEPLKFSDKFNNYFSAINSIKINRKHLQDIVNSNENNYQTELDCKTSLIVPGGRDKFGNAYIICMTAQELIKLMITEDGLLRRNMFDDNVRDSQGFSNVNQEILSTLKSSPDRFVLFNNGITIVCKKASNENGKYVLENPQIVNGCQTCNMIYQAYRDGINLDGVQIIAKIVGSNKEDVTQGIVRGANRQNIVYEEAFETIRGFHKGLEKYFESNQVKGFEKIYYERRSRQYSNNVQIKPHQKISFRGLIQSMVALFLNHVEDSHKHEYTLLKSYKNSLFIDTHSCQPYYLAAFLYLNVDTLFRGKKLPEKLSSYKMHIMLLMKEMKGGPSPDLSSADIDSYCSRLFQALTGNAFISSAIEACKKFENITAEWIKSKGEQYRYGIKDSSEFRNFLMENIYGTADTRDAEKIYTGYVLNVKPDKYHNLFGFIEHTPNNIFFHEFDNPDITPSYVGKKVCYKIINDGNRKRAINVRIMET